MKRNVQKSAHVESEKMQLHQMILWDAMCEGEGDNI